MRRKHSYIARFRGIRAVVLPLLPLAIAMGWVGRVAAVPIVGLYTTGVNNAGVVLAPGTIDPHYQLISSDDPVFPGPDAFATLPKLPANWLPNTNTSQWVSPNPSQTQSGGAPSSSVGNPAGTYIYDLAFTLTSQQASTISITGSWAVEGIGLIELNAADGGGSVPGTMNLNGAGQSTSFTIPQGSPFVLGVNHLDFVAMSGAAGPNGFQVVNIAATPEPSTLLLAALAGVAMLARRSRRLA